MKVTSLHDRLLGAPDLVSRQEYKKVDGRKVLVAITRSSKRLGLEEREQMARPAVPQSEFVSRKKGERNG